MSTLIIQANNMFTLDVSVNDGDVYSESVHLKMERNFGNGNVKRTDEAYLTPVQLELLGRFLIRKADELKTMHTFREQA